MRRWEDGKWDSSILQGYISVWQKGKMDEGEIELNLVNVQSCLPYRCFRLPPAAYI